VSGAQTTPKDAGLWRDISARVLKTATGDHDISCNTASRTLEVEIPGKTKVERNDG